MGATIEWYDFFMYGTAAGLVFPQLFFPSGNPTVSTLAAYATFAVGFVARPIGGVVFGHYGDRLGRKAMLVLTILIMGMGTFLIGLLPTYDSIGIWVPILLVTLRILQGIGLGGEWGGAVLMAVEHAPPEKRGWYGSWPQMGVPAGLLLGTLMFTALSALPDEQFLAWGWRIAFLSSAVLLVVGTYIRVKISETPAFAKAEDHSERKIPIVDLFRTQPRHVLLACGARIADGVSFNIWAVFSIGYATTQLGLPRTTILTAVSVGAAVMFVMIGVWGAMSDRRGRRPVMGAGAAAFALPGFLLLNTGEPLWITLALVVAFGVIHPALYTVMAPFFSELFEALLERSLEARVWRPLYGHERMLHTTLGNGQHQVRLVLDNACCVASGCAAGRGRPSVINQDRQRSGLCLSSPGATGPPAPGVEIWTT